MRLERGTLASQSQGDEQVEPAAQSASALAGSTPAATAPERIGERYQVRETLGRGGMAVVYRVFDTQDGRELALKQLLSQRDEGETRKIVALFEREYHTLAQLTHPRVIEVYDYGVAEGRAYYTMELLDGGDLRERCPVSWRDACRFMFDVCSSLALLHSRRLVHRDISPRNVRCTSSGAAKLIDFGALVPMGTGGSVVGTPAFVAPEVLHRSGVDGRADLFSLGATFYYALVGRPPYPAYDFAELSEAWRQKPPPPSHANHEVPPALDALIMSLLSLEPLQRPRNAFDVMQRVSALGGLEDVEALQVSRAYLTTPVLVGREPALRAVHEQLEQAREGGARVALIAAPAGLGRSRLLDAAVLEAKTLGASVLRASGRAQAESLSVARALLEQVLAVFGGRAVQCARSIPGAAAALFAPMSEGSAELPRLRELSAMQADAPAVIDASCMLLRELAREQLAVIALDDVHEIDDPSCSLFATLADRTQRERFLLLLTADSAALAPPRPALALLCEHAVAVQLPALDGEQTGELLGSLFGDVPNVALVSQRVFQIAGGKPRETMELAQHLVDEGVVSYQGGSWVLPSQLDANSLPDSAAQALALRVVGLSPLARFIAEAQSISLHPGFTRDDYCALCASEPPQRVDAAIAELLAHQVLQSDGRLHLLSQGSRNAGLAAHLDAEALRVRHAALAELYLPQPERPTAVVEHLLAAGQTARAIEYLMAHLRTVEDERAGLFKITDMNADQLASLFARSLAAAEQVGRSQFERAELLRYLTTLGVVADADVFARFAPRWLALLERDSGLQLYREDVGAPDALTRLQRSFDVASERHAALPEHERGYPPAEGIRLLVHYVVISIAVGARTRNAELIASLPELLEPFVALSPLIDAMRENSLATWEVNCGCLSERAHQRVTALYERLADVSGADLHHVRSIRTALAYCAGAIEAGMGRVSAMTWADVLDQDNLQLVNAMHLRKLVRLQQGDAEGTERYRHQAELLAARAVWRQMFAGTALGELPAYARARDLTGVKRALTEIERHAAHSPGWIDGRWLAEGHLQRLRGNLEGAREAYERCLAMCAPDPREPRRSINCWPGATAGLMQTAIEQGDCERAVALGERALAQAAERNIGSAIHEVVRVLALAEGLLGRYESACTRLDKVIAEQLKLGISGLWLGASYETRARIAIAAGDSEQVEHYSLLTAREYRHGQGSPLGALYEQLIEDARKAGVRVPPQLSDFESRMMQTAFARRSGTQTRVTQALRAAHGSKERAERALELLCEGRSADAGHLCLAGESGLTLAASRNLPPPDAALLQRAAEYLDRQLNEEPELATIAVAAAGTPARAIALEDESGNVHYPVVLSCTVDGATVCAGIALIAASGEAGAQRPVPPDLIAAVSALLIEAGRTQAMRTRAER